MKNESGCLLSKQVYKNDVFKVVHYIKRPSSVCVFAYD